MKQTENNEIDLLLRGLARREGAHAFAPEDHSIDHLDADELNSYAEQVLPAAARARYTTHLADCESCRKIVSELTSASGVKVSEHSVSPEASGLRQKLAALFSPRLLRYALPAVALSAFIAVGLIAFRQQSESEIAQSSQVSPPDVATAAKPTDLVAKQQESQANDPHRFYDSQTGSEKGKDNFAKSGERGDTSSVPTSTDSVSVTDGRDASPGKAAGAVAQPSYAPEPAAPPAPKPQTEIAETRTEVVARQNKEADKNEDEAMRGKDGARARTDDNQNQVSRSIPYEAPAHKSEEKRRAPAVGKIFSGVGAKAKKDEAETRTVSGRRFQRQGDVWVDTAFQSSTATTILSRGSEQFRALVADEPGIREIAAQLSGEVVVVWKGRAYRIR